MLACVCVCVCVKEREGERGKEAQIGGGKEMHIEKYKGENALVHTS